EGDVTYICVRVLKEVCVVFCFHLAARKMRWAARSYRIFLLVTCDSIEIDRHIVALYSFVTHPKNFRACEESVMRSFVQLLMVQIVLIVMPTVTSAQTGAALTGVVTDTTGAVLPGVTVEARSPALIEQVRSAVTDETGRYRH